MKAPFLWCASLHEIQRKRSHVNWRQYFLPTLLRLSSKTCIFISSLDFMSSNDASAALFAWKFVEFYRWLVGTDSGRSLFIFALQLGIAQAPPTLQWLMTCAIIDLHWLTTNYNWHRGPNWQDFWPFQFWIYSI